MRVFMEAKIKCKWQDVLASKCNYYEGHKNAGGGGISWGVKGAKGAAFSIRLALN